MSTMGDTRPKRKRRSFTDEFKAGAVRLVLDEGRGVAAVARDLDLTESSLRNWRGSGNVAWIADRIDIVLVWSGMTAAACWGAAWTRPVWLMMSIGALASVAWSVKTVHVH